MPCGGPGVREAPAFRTAPFISALPPPSPCGSPGPTPRPSFVDTDVLFRFGPRAPGPTTDGGLHNRRWSAQKGLPSLLDNGA